MLLSFPGVQLVATAMSCFLIQIETVTDIDKYGERHTGCPRRAQRKEG